MPISRPNLFFFAPPTKSKCRASPVSDIRPSAHNQSVLVQSICAHLHNPTLVGRTFRPHKPTDKRRCVFKISEVMLGIRGAAQQRRISAGFMPQSKVPAEIREKYPPFRVQHGRNPAQQAVQASASSCMVFRGIVAMSVQLMGLVEVGDCLEDRGPVAIRRTATCAPKVTCWPPARRGVPDSRWPRASGQAAMSTARSRAGRTRARDRSPDWCS